MTEKEFIEFIIKVVNFTVDNVKRESEKHQLRSTEDPLILDWRRLNNLGLYEDSQGNLGFAIDWESDGKCGDAEIFLVRRK